jgi:hypothetical protein
MSPTVGDIVGVVIIAGVLTHVVHLVREAHARRQAREPEEREEPASEADSDRKSPE